MPHAKGYLSQAALHELTLTALDFQNENTLTWQVDFHFHAKTYLSQAFLHKLTLTAPNFKINITFHFSFYTLILKCYFIFQSEFRFSNLMLALLGHCT